MKTRRSLHRSELPVDSIKLSSYEMPSDHHSTAEVGVVDEFGELGKVFQGVEVGEVDQLDGLGEVGEGGEGGEVGEGGEEGGVNR